MLGKLVSIEIENHNVNVTLRQFIFRILPLLIPATKIFNIG